jgi:hypothetical protein
MEKIFYFEGSLQHFVYVNMRTLVQINRLSFLLINTIDLQITEEFLDSRIYPSAGIYSALSWLEIEKFFSV